jgi:hypothetical protein
VTLSELRELLEILKDAGVTRYEAADLKIEMGSSGKWTDFRSELARQREAEEEDEERVQFAHVAGGPPPRINHQ